MIQKLNLEARLMQAQTCVLPETSIKLEGGLGQRVELGQGQAESPGRVEGAGQGHMSTITQDPSTEMA